MRHFTPMLCFALAASYGCGEEASSGDDTTDAAGSSSEGGSAPTSSGGSASSSSASSTSSLTSSSASSSATGTSSDGSGDSADTGGVKPDLGPYEPESRYEPPEESASWETIEVEGLYYGGGEEGWPWHFEPCGYTDGTSYCVYWTIWPPLTHDQRACRATMRVRGRLSPRLSSPQEYCTAEQFDYALVVDELLEITCDPTCRPERTLQCPPTADSHFCEMR